MPGAVLKTVSFATPKFFKNLIAFFLSFLPMASLTTFLLTRVSDCIFAILSGAVNKSGFVSKASRSAWLKTRSYTSGKGSNIGSVSRNGRRFCYVVNSRGVVGARSVDLLVTLTKGF